MTGTAPSAATRGSARTPPQSDSDGGKTRRSAAATPRQAGGRGILGEVGGFVRRRVPLLVSQDHKDVRAIARMANANLAIGSDIPEVGDSASRVGVGLRGHQRDPLNDQVHAKQGNRTAITVSLCAASRAQANRAAGRRSDGSTEPIAHRTAAISPTRPRDRRCRFGPPLASSRSPDAGRAARRRDPVFVVAAVSFRLTRVLRLLKLSSDAGDKLDASSCGRAVARALARSGLPALRASSLVPGPRRCLAPGATASPGARGLSLRWIR